MSRQLVKFVRYLGSEDNWNGDGRLFEVVEGTTRMLKFRHLVVLLTSSAKQAAAATMLVELSDPVKLTRTDDDQDVSKITDVPEAGKTQIAEVARLIGLYDPEAILVAAGYEAEGGEVGGPVRTDVIEVARAKELRVDEAQEILNRMGMAKMMGVPNSKLEGFQERLVELGFPRADLGPDDEEEVADGEDPQA